MIHSVNPTNIRKPVRKPDVQPRPERFTFIGPAAAVPMGTAPGAAVVGIILAARYTPVAQMSAPAATTASRTDELESKGT
jgi:hypothetical protein